jgi:uncharacterized membrane protein
MMTKTNSAIAAITSVLALSAFASAAPAAQAPAMEKCYGIAKAGKNDCAGTAHACSGQSKIDASGLEFISLPKGTCDRLTGGTLAPKK